MNILVFGDSIVQGLCDTKGAGWVNRLAAHTYKQAFDSDWEKYSVVFNLGISGDRIGWLADRFEAEFAARQPDSRKSEDMLTIFAIGINDAVVNLSTETSVTDLDMFRKVYSTLITKAQKHSSVMLVGLLPIDEKILNPIPWYAGHALLEGERQKFNQVIAELATTHDCQFVTMDSVIDFTQTVDGLHPNVTGHQLIFERIKGVLEKEEVL